MLEILPIGTYRNPIARHRSQHLDWYRNTRACAAGRLAETIVPATSAVPTILMLEYYPTRWIRQWGLQRV